MITAIPAFNDNYIWLYQNTQHEAFVVDPGQSEPVIKFFEKNDLNLKAILLTHSHEDHVGGVRAIKAEFPEIEIYGPEEVEEYVTHVVHPEDEFQLLGKPFKVILTAGHTVGHVSYIMEDSLFCGDALFSAGCGRVFTGDYQAAYDGLQRLRQLDDKTKIYAGHEYTLTNLKFAQTQTDSEMISDEIEQVNQLLTNDQPSLPSTMAKEKVINLFMMAENLDQFVQLRKMRDQF